MAEPQTFQNYLFSQSVNGSNIELARTPDEVVCLAFDLEREIFVQFHILVNPVENGNEFGEAVEALKGMDSPPIARLVEAGCDEDSWYYVTEHVDGEPLDAYLDRVRQLQGPTAAWLSQDLLEAVVRLGQSVGMPLQLDFRDFRVVRRGERLVPVLTRFPLHLADQGVDKQRPFHVSKSEFERDARPLRELLRAACRGRDRSARMKSGWVRSVELRRILEVLLEGNLRLRLSELASLRDDLQRFTGLASDDDAFSDSEPASVLGSYVGDSRVAQRLAAPEYKLKPVPRRLMRSFAFAAEERGGGDEVTIQLLPPESLCGPGISERVREVVSLFNSRDHPHVIRIETFHEDNPAGLWYAETTPPGRPLDQWLAAEGSFSPNQAHELLIKLQFALREGSQGGLGEKPVALGDIYVDEAYQADEAEQEDQGPESFFGAVTVRLHPTLEKMLEANGQPSGGTEEDKTDWVIQLGLQLMGLDPAVDRGRLKRKGFPDPLVKLIEAVWAGAPLSAVSNRIEFLERFGRVLESSQRTPVKRKIAGKAASLGRQLGALTPINLAGKKRDRSSSSPDDAGGEDMPTAHSAPIPGFLQPETVEADESPGFAEALMIDRHESGEEEDRDEVSPFAGMHGDGDPELSEDARLYLKKRSFSRYAFIAAVVLIGSAAVAAMVAHFRGNAIWQRSPEQIEPGAGEPSPAEPTAAEREAAERETAERSGEGSAPGSEGGPTGSETASPDPSVVDSTPDEDEGPGRTAVELPPPGGVDLGGVPESVASEEPDGGEMVDGSGTESTPVDDEAAAGVPEELRDLLASAREGDATDQAELGTRLRNSQPEQARRWLRSAAEQMDTGAMLTLAEMLQRGEGGSRDDTEAYRMLARAANQGEVEAYVPLARAFMDGRGVDRQPEIAVEYLRASAVRDDPRANLMLAQVYERGELGQPDIQEAAVWYRRAAELGHSVAEEWCRQNGIPFGP